MRGQTVKLNSAKGIIERVVVEDHGSTVSVSTRAEIKRAAHEGRRPHCAAFLKRDVVA